MSRRRPAVDRPASIDPEAPHARHRRPATLLPASPPQSPGPRWAAFTTAVRAHRPVAHDLDVREGEVPFTGDGLGHFFSHP